MSSQLSIPKKLRKKVDAELQLGESIQWIDQPIIVLYLLAYNPITSIVCFLFGFFWTKMLLTAIMPALKSFVLGELQINYEGPPEFIPFVIVYSLVFPLIGIGLMSVPLFAWKGIRNTAYLVTNKRAIIIQGSKSISYFPDQLDKIIMAEHKNGTGSIVIETIEWRCREGSYNYRDVGFIGIRNPREVEKILKQLAHNIKS
jgi:hypothetical protein